MTTLPEKLYKYRNPNSRFLEDTIQAAFEGKRLWFSALKDQNDEFEAEPLFKKSSILEIKSWMENELPRSKLLESAHHFDKKRRKEARRNTLPTTKNAIRFRREYPAVFAAAAKQQGIFSLSKRYDIQTMWGHYGDGGKGICLEFTVLDLPFKPGQRSPNPVRYVENRPVYDSIDALRFTFSEALLEGKIDYASTSALRKFVDTVLLTKSKAWAYEEEFRILGRSYSGYERNDTIQLTGLIFGSKASDSLISNYIENYQGKLSLSFLEKRSDGSYGFNRREIA